jgi:hypothetical protein
MRLSRLFALSAFFCGQSLFAETYTPPAIKPEAILSGRIETFTFSQSKVFADTVGQVTVFIPAQDDGISDNNVRFFDEELLPFVAKQYQLNLSTSGNDRCTAGASSGGITAFTAA